MDVIQWTLGQNAPLRVAAMGGKYAVEDNREVPDTAKVMWEFPGGALASFNQYNANGAKPLKGQEMEFRGTKGTAYVFNKGFEIVPEVVREHSRYQRSPIDRDTERKLKAKTETFIEPMKVQGSSDTAFHARNFLDCVKSRERCNADIEIGHRSTSATLIGNIALKTGKMLEWDGEREQFTNELSANQFLLCEYRKGYELPKI